jgi:hypothetical protein
VDYFKSYGWRYFFPVGNVQLVTGIQLLSGDGTVPSFSTVQYRTTVEKIVVEEDYDARTYGPIRLHD